MTTLATLADLDLLPADLARRFGEPRRASVTRPSAAEVREGEGESLAELLAFLELEQAVDGVPASEGLRLVDGTVEGPSQMGAAAYARWARRQPVQVAERLLAPAGAVA